MVAEKVKLLDLIEVFLHRDRAVLQLLAEQIVVCCWDSQELAPSCLHSGDCFNDVISSQSDVLHSCSTVEVDVFLNLTLTFAISGLVDGHLDVLIEIGNDNGAESREFSVDLLIIYRPKTMEVKMLFVPGSCGFHITFSLVANAMVHELKSGAFENLVQGFSVVMSSVTREERTLVVNALHESVNSITVGLHGGNENFAIFVFHSDRFTHRFGSTRNSLLVNTFSIIDSESNILDTITMLGVMLRELLVFGVQGRCETEDNVASTDNMSAEFTLASLKTL